MERRTLGVCVGGLLLVAVVSVAAIQPTGQLVEADDTVVGYRAWVPDDVASLRGVIVGSMGANWDYRRFVQRPAWQAAARNWGFALLGTSNRKKAAMKQGDDAVGDDLLKALAVVGKSSGHAELTNAVICAFGFSRGAGTRWPWRVRCRNGSWRSARAVRRRRGSGHERG